MRAINLKCEQLADPIGIDVVSPRLSWQAEGGLVQTAYEVKAYKNSATAPVFESGKVASSVMAMTLPVQLGSRDRIRWTLQLWDEEDHPGETAEGRFEMGLLAPEDWEAKWIDPEKEHPEEERQPASYLKRTFELSEKGLGRLYITCHGLYEVWINGVRVGDQVLTPGADDYRKRLQYQVYDTTPYLQQGENELRVILGDGWYRGNNGIDGLSNLYGKDQALLCQLEVNGKAVVVSDEYFEASQQGPIRLNDMEKGEVYDARMATVEGWHAVRVIEEETGNYDKKLLCASNAVSIREKERFEGRIFTTPNGETVVDFGQNLAGYTYFKVFAKEGDKLTLWHGETLDENGNFTQKNFDPGERNKNGGIPQRIEYTCKEGWNEYKPAFALFGFRYVKVETNIDLTNAVFTSIAVYSDMEETASFTCGNKDVDRLFLNSVWSMKSNFADIPTDCPTRERAGWTGDAGAFAPTGRYLMNCYSVLRKWLSECRLAQGEDGLIANIAPINNASTIISKILQGSAGWSDAVVLVPWALYEAYGDKTILEENYEMMTRFLAFVKDRAKKTRLTNLRNPWRDYLVDHGFHFGEWCEPDVDNADVMRKVMMHGAPEVATAYYYRSADLVSKIAAILGKTEDAKTYADIAENAKNAYRFTCTKNGKINSDRQAEYVRPIAFGLLNEEESKAAAKELALKIAQNGNHLNTGFLATPFLCRTLADNGYTGTAYSLLLQENSPSWLYAVKHGATTIWETWEGVKEDGTVKDSLNHYSYGAISGFLMDTVLGIRLEEVFANAASETETSAAAVSEGGGLKAEEPKTPYQFVIAPHPDKRLGSAEGSFRSPIGEVRVSWRYEGDTVVLDMTVPCNTTARLELDGLETQVLAAGIHHFEVK